MTECNHTSWTRCRKIGDLKTHQRDLAGRANGHKSKPIQKVTVEQGVMGSEAIEVRYILRVIQSKCFDSDVPPGLNIRERFEKETLTHPRRIVGAQIDACHDRRIRRSRTSRHHSSAWKN